MKQYIKMIEGLALAVLLSTGLVACSENGGSASTKSTAKQEKPVEKSSSSSIGRVSEDNAWTFATVPMPEPGNPPRFVSNPDGVLSPEAEAEVNRILLYSKVDLGIESCVIVVNHVDNSDVESFAYAMFDNFADNNHMMLIVLAYQDHGVRMELGHELESKLSEVECQQLLDNILIPYLREENPDEGMIALVEGVYNKMSKKKH